MPQAQTVSAEEFDALFERCKNWGRWGAGDQRGTLNLITPQKVRQAAALVEDGVTVSCSLPLPTLPGPTNPNPVTHLMIAAGDLPPLGSSLAGGSQDYFAMAHHGPAVTHLDAFCHIWYRDQLYNGFPKSKVTSRGALAGAIDVTRAGIVSRGILLDIPWSRGVDYLEPGEAILAEDLERCEELAKVRVEAGDILLIRTGRHTRTRLGVPAPAPLPGPIPMQPLAGLHASTGPWLHDRGVAVLGGDNFSDVLPSGVAVAPFPVHVLTLVAMGCHLLDNADLDPLAQACRERGRWAFQLLFGPLILERGTGSPVNPIAVL